MREVEEFFIATYRIAQWLWSKVLQLAARIAEPKQQDSNKGAA